ncbi:MAG: IgGFc-binding protein, partial [Prevotellaceae bacterium]|nr:IgGFc-binding protein [Prevotellaceae bacterium]
MINIKTVNRNILSILLCMILFFHFAGKLCAQGISTQGTDFWLSFGNNMNASYINVNLQVRIVTSDAATVKLTYTYDNADTIVNIAAGSVYTYSFTETERLKLYSDVTGITGKSLHIESNVPVSVYALNQYAYTTDATNVLPVDALGADYYHISYLSVAWNPPLSDGYTVIATEDVTEIYENGILKASLQKGEVYSAYFSTTDLTGKHITSNKSIAYFVTSESVFVPKDLWAADCLYQQLIPVNKWGNNFLVPITHRGIERIRIIASQDGTIITQTGGVIKTDNGGYSQNSLNLNRGEFVELEASLTGCGCYISSNKPVGVCTYLIGMDNLSLLTTKGDPAMAWVPPVEQSINGTLIAPFVPDGITALDEHYALIITPTASKNLTTVATGTNPATALTGGSWCDNTASNFSFYSLQLSNNSNDAYYFANPYGLTVMGYGIGSYESYYYFAGAAARDLDLAFYYTNPGISDTIHHQDLEGMAFCDTVAHFSAVVQYAMSATPGYLKWFIDNVEQNAVRDSLSWWTTSLSPGVHTVDLVALGLNGDIDTASSTFTISAPEINTITDIICWGTGKYHDYGFDTLPQQTGMIYDT